MMPKFLPYFFVFLVAIGCNSPDGKPDDKSRVDSSAAIQTDGLAKTPPMGWNSWNAFGENVNEEVVKQTVDAFVSSGLKDAGFEYIVIDDLWQGGRDSSSGLLFADAKKFPSGIKKLADYVHSKGLKFGIYSDAGTKTCGGMPGSYGFEEKDANLFAEWGVDFLKYDYCYCPDYVSANNDYKMAINRYKAMGDALRKTGRPIVFSICEWGPRSPWLWGREVGGHMWRTSYDVADIWDKPRNEHSPIGILTSIDVMANLARFAGPGGWNDPDMLVVGLNNSGFIKGGGCTPAEYNTQMKMWCMFSAPLMIGGDVRNMSDETKKILLNRRMIEIDQDPLGKQGFRVYSNNGLDVWKKPLSGDRFAIALFNRNDRKTKLSVSSKDLELEDSVRYVSTEVTEAPASTQALEELTADLQSHETRVFIISKSPK